MWLEEVKGLPLETILTKLGPKGTAVLACVSTRLRESASAEPVWRAFCSLELRLHAPLDPAGSPCPSFMAAYRSWRQSFAMYPWRLVIRAKRCWDDIKNWLTQNFPEAGQTLQMGASEAEINQVESFLVVKFPLPTRVLYRLCNGQETKDRPQHSRLGIIGGYGFEDHQVNVHLLPLREIRPINALRRGPFGLSIGSKYINVADSYDIEIKRFFLNCDDGQLYVGTGHLPVDTGHSLKDGQILPCVPRALIRLVCDGGSDAETQQDGMLLWLEEHTRCLQNGQFRLRTLNGQRMISLFPETAPLCTVAVTNGVQVRASALFFPELTQLSDHNDQDSGYRFAYLIRMSLLPEGCMLDGTHYDTCQLYSWHFIIRANDNVLSHMHGENVIGKFPLLSASIEEFVYEGGVVLPTSSGSIEGSFTFVPGSLTYPEGRHFKVKLARFPLEVPSYIF